MFEVTYPYPISSNRADFFVNGSKHFKIPDCKIEQLLLRFLRRRGTPTVRGPLMTLCRWGIFQFQLQYICPL